MDSAVIVMCIDSEMASGDGMRPPVSALFICTAEKGKVSCIAVGTVLVIRGRTQSGGRGAAPGTRPDEVSGGGPVERNTNKRCR